MGIAPTVRHPIRCWCEAKFWAHLVVERQGSGGLAFTPVETEEGRLAGLGTGKDRRDRRGHAGVCWGCGVDAQQCEHNRQGHSDYDSLSPAAVGLVCHLKTFSAVQAKRLTLQGGVDRYLLLLLDTTQCSASPFACLPHLSVHSSSPHPPILHPPSLIHATPLLLRSQYGQKVICHIRDSKFPLASFRAQPQLGPGKRARARARSLRSTKRRKKRNGSP